MRKSRTARWPAWPLHLPLSPGATSLISAAFRSRPTRAVPAVDRGHLIPHLSGGQFGPNIFRQDRALNRGWSPEGRRFRALEREAAASPGTFYFGHLLYDDDSAYPVAIEIGITRGGTLHAERFQNRFPAGH